MTTQTSVTVHFSSQAVKDLKKLPLATRKRVLQKITLLTSSGHDTQVKMLHGKDVAQFRLRVGDYRILYDLYEHEQVLLILRVGHRKDIYR